MNPKFLEELRADLEGDGFIPGTERFERELRAKKVPICRDLRMVTSCIECSHFDHCELIRNYMADLAYAKDD